MRGAAISIVKFRTAVPVEMADCCAIAGTGRSCKHQDLVYPRQAVDFYAKEDALSMAWGTGDIGGFDFEMIHSQPLRNRDW